MADSFIRVAPDSTGKYVQTFSNLIGGNTVEANAVALVDQFGLPIGTSTAPMPVIDNDVTTSGTITATDAVVAAPAGDGTFRTGTSTAGSYIVLKCPGGDSAWNIAITGTWTGTLYFEGSPDSTNGIDGNWININGRQTGIVNTVLSGSTTAGGMFRGNTSGLTYLRLRCVGTLTGTPGVRINISSGIGATFLNASIPAGSNTIGSVTALPPAITKGTQGGTGFTTQDLKDAGRNVTNYWMTVPVLTTNADALMSLTGYKSGAAVGSTNTPAVVTAGKTYRVISIALAYVATTVAGACRVSLRANTSGVVALASPVVAQWLIGTGTPGTAGSSQTEVVSLGDGMEFAAGTGIGITIAGVAPAGTLLATGYGQASILGFEY